MQKSAPNWLSESTRGEVGSQGAECRWKFRGRELNPGILRDRRKYEPLYYCGLASASVLILHGAFRLPTVIEYIAGKCVRCGPPQVVVGDFAAERNRQRRRIQQSRNVVRHTLRHDSQMNPDTASQTA